MLSSAARAIWASVLPRVRPVMLPRASPLPHGTADEDAALHRIGPLRKRRLGLPGASARLGCQLRGAGGQQAVVRGLESGAQVHQHEAARAVGVLGHAGGKAGLAEQRALLVARHAADAYAVAEQIGG